MHQMTEQRNLAISCQKCSWRKQCLPSQIDYMSTVNLESILVRGRLRAGRPLFRAAERPNFLYIVRSGSLRTEIHDRDGMLHVTGFFLPLNMIGSEGFASARYRSDAVALEDSDYCAIPLAALPALISAEPQFAMQVIRLVRGELAHAHDHIVLLGKPNPFQRVAMFINDLLERCGTIQTSSNTLLLSMSRRDIASYVSLAIETVSRTLSKMQDQGVLVVRRRSIHVLDTKKLRDIAASP